MEKQEWTGKLVEKMYSIKIPDSGGFPYLALDNPAGDYKPGLQPLYGILKSYLNKNVKITIEEI